MKTQKNPETQLDPHFAREVQRLHRFTVYLRWAIAIACWLVLAPIALWSLRRDIALMREHFTWAALRYALAFTPIATLCLATCLGMTAGVLVWQSRNILWGLSSREQRILEQQVRTINKRGKKHPLWDWIHK